MYYRAISRLKYGLSARAFTSKVRLDQPSKMMQCFSSNSLGMRSWVVVVIVVSRSLFVAINATYRGEDR